MRFLNWEQAAEYLSGATIESSDDQGHAIVHAGVNCAGARFVMVNAADGVSVVTEGM